MAQLSAGNLASVTVLAGFRPPAAIDLDHLARVTFGDHSLEREVLRLFDRQATMLLTRMREASGPPLLAAHAHTLKGSAKGVGAWDVAKRAESLEAAARVPDTSLLPLSLEQLSVSVAQARAAIADLLRPH